MRSRERLIQVLESVNERVVGHHPAQACAHAHKALNYLGKHPHVSMPLIENQAEVAESEHIRELLDEALRYIRENYNQAEDIRVTKQLKGAGFQTEELEDLENLEQMRHVKPTMAKRQAIQEAARRAPPESAYKTLTAEQARRVRDGKWIKEGS